MLCNCMALVQLPLFYEHLSFICKMIRLSQISGTRIEEHRTGNVAMLVECLLHKRETWSLIPQNHTKKVMLAYITALRRLRQENQKLRVILCYQASSSLDRVRPYHMRKELNYVLVSCLIYIVNRVIRIFYLK